MHEEMGIGDGRSTLSGFRARDVSPDSVIFTANSNFSLFSSTSGSAERCSFASDLHDHDSIASEVSQLAGHECREASSSSGPDPDPRKVTSILGPKTSHVSRKEKVKVQKFDSSEADTEDEILYLDSARSSFSQALKECQERRSRSEALLKKADRRRPASLDLNNTVINAAHSSSPRLDAVKKSVMARQTGMFPSPGTPNYRHASVGIQKGWSSERVPLHSNANRRLANTALLPYNNGRALPSKWEDAERWILSPVLGDGTQRPSFQQQQKKPKSKSGPLGPPGAAYYSLYSPALPMFEGGNVGAKSSSPFSAGVLASDGLSIRYAAHRGSGNLFFHPEPYIARSVSVHGYSELVSQSSLPGPQEIEEKEDGTRDAATDTSRAVSRRDMATQMSPEGSPCSSPGRRSSCSTSTPSIIPIIELQSIQSKSDIRDVQVDDRVTVTRWSKKNKACVSGKVSGNGDDWKKKAVDIRSSSWEVSETAKSISKIKREEARITAWENLQKAKAEAAIRKLEMKLEKKRSSSMDKILSKLRSAQKKAQEMRSSALVNQSHQVSRTSSHKAISFHRTRQIGSLSGCFTCHAF